MMLYELKFANGIYLQKDGDFKRPCKAFCEQQVGILFLKKSQYVSSSDESFGYFKYTNHVNNVPLSVVLGIGKKVV